MKFTKFTLFLAALLALSGESYAASSWTVPCHTAKSGKKLVADSGCTWELNAGVLQFDNGATTDVSGVVFSTGTTANPLVQTTEVDLPVAAVSSSVGTGGGVIIASAAGRKIYPLGFSIMVSGTAAGATSIQIGCSDLTTKIATVPIANLVSLVPVGTYMASASTSQIVYGAALVTGCPSGAGVVASAVGNALTTTTDVFISMPYTIQ